MLFDTWDETGLRSAGAGPSRRRMGNQTVLKPRLPPGSPATSRGSRSRRVRSRSGPRSRPIATPRSFWKIRNGSDEKVNGVGAGRKWCVVWFGVWFGLVCVWHGTASLSFCSVVCSVNTFSHPQTQHPPRRLPIYALPHHTALVVQ